MLVLRGQMMNRREFARTGLAAMLACKLEPCTAIGQMVTGALKPRVSIMLWTLGRKLAPDVALDTVAKAGYSAVELLSDYKTWDHDRLEAFISKLKQTNIVVDSMVTGGQSLANPDLADQLVDSVKASIPFARDFGCSQFILTPNSLVQGQSQEMKRQTIIDTLKRISDVTQKENIEVLLEPIDLLERKDSSVTSVAEGLEIVRAVARPNVKVLYDFYHEQRGTGNLLQKLDGNIDLIGLVHVADVPKRSEPGTGEMNYPALYKKLAEMKYSRYIAMEFYPTGDPVTILKQAKAEVERVYATV
jgi:hydroxypyruvate isomerase